MFFNNFIFGNYVFADDFTSALDINASSALLVDNKTNKILYSKNENKKMFPASTTKIVTAILVLENHSLDEKVTASYDAVMSIPSGYSTADIQIEEELTVEQLLELLLVHSANDAANVLAFHVSGSISSFANLMNQKVADLGLTNTHFTNPSGMHDENHYTTAHDLAILMKYCMKNSTFRSLAGLKSCTIPATNKYEERIFKTTNDLLIYDNRDVESNYYYKYAIAGKTGYTTEAKNCLVSVANKDNFELISVVLGAGIYPNNLSAKFIDTKAIFDYGYDNYAIRKIRDKNAIATQITVDTASKDTRNLDLLITDDITAIVSQKDFKTEFTPEIKIQENLSAPIAQGQILGKIIYNIDGIEYSSNLIASHSVEKSTFGIFIFQVILIVLILFLLYKLLFNKNNRNKFFRKKPTIFY